MRPKGFRGYMILTVGQLVSIAGSAMTQFGLGIWMWEKTGNATPFSMITVAFFLSNVLFLLSEVLWLIGFQEKQHLYYQI